MWSDTFFPSLCDLLGCKWAKPQEKASQWNKLTLLEETVPAWGLLLPYILWTMAIYPIWFRDRSKAIHCKFWRFARIWPLVPRNFLTPITDSQVLTQEFSSEKCRCKNTMLKSSEKLRQAFGPEGDQWLCGKQWEETWQHTFSTNLAGSCHASNIVPQEIVSHTYISQSRGANPVQGASIVCHLKKTGAHLFFRLHLFFTNRISICISLSLANCFWREREWATSGAGDTPHPPSSKHTAQVTRAQRTSHSPRPRLWWQCLPGGKPLSNKTKGTLKKYLGGLRHWCCWRGLRLLGYVYIGQIFSTQNTSCSETNKKALCPLPFCILFSWWGLQPSEKPFKLVFAAKPRVFPGQMKWCQSLHSTSLQF